MWFGTPDGLCRYDGSVLITYRYEPALPDAPVNNFVRGKLLEDKSGNIWYTNETGIFKWSVLSQKIEIVYPFRRKDFGNTQFAGITLDKQNNLWMLSLPGGLASYNIITKQLKFLSLPVPVGSRTILYSYSTVDLEGNIWMRVVTANEPFLKLNTSTGKFSKEFIENPPHAVIFDIDKMVLTYDDKLVVRYNTPSPDVVITKQINNKKIPFFSLSGLADSHDRFWFTALGKGLMSYNEADGKFYEYHHENSKLKSLAFDLTTCLYIDRSDNLWIGIDGGGVAKIDLKQPRFYVFPQSEGDYPVLKDYFTKCFYEDDKRRIWFGSHNNGFSIYDPATTLLINYKNNPLQPGSLPGNSVQGFYRDSRQNMWLMTSGGLCLFNEGKETFKVIAVNNLPAQYQSKNLSAYKFTELKNGDFMMVTLIGLVYITRLATGRFVANYVGNNNFLSSTSTDIVEMDDKTFFIANPGIGLLHFKKADNSFKLIKMFFNDVDLRSIRIDEQHDNILWIASAKGLIRFNTSDEKYEIWNSKNGLANSYVYGSLEDEKHNLWISTNGGLSYLDRNNNQIDNYSYQDGLQSNEFNTQAFYKSATNTFYFGGIKGFNWFKSKPFSANSQKPQVAITEVDIDDKIYLDSTLILHKNLFLPYYKNDLHFKFASLDHTRPQANRITYKLDGWDNKWITTYLHSARYANLTPGKYTLRVKASNAAGVWSDEEQINLRIFKPLWNEYWFYFLMGLIFIMLVVLITYAIVKQRVKQRLQKLEKQAAINIERNRISKDMHDEIGNGLTHIALLSELIQQHQPGLSIQKDITSISTSARQLVQSMSEIIWSMSPQNDTLENLLAYIREQTHQYFEGMHLNLVIDFPEVPASITLTNEERRNIFLVTKEAMANAMKHAHATTISLSLEILDGYYCFNVTDNGVGLSINKTRVSSNGVKNMKKRMQDINGTIKWISQPKGTRVEYCLPL